MNDNDSSPANRGVPPAAIPLYKSPLFIILCLALALRWLHLLMISGTDLLRLPIIDAAFYHQWATAISRGQSFAAGPFFMSPLYPYLTGLIYALFGAEIWRMLLFQGLLSVGAIALTYRWTARVFNRESALAAAGILALYAPSIFFDATLLTSSLILFLSAAILNFTQDALDRGQPGDMAKLGGLIGLSALARPLALVFLPALLAAFIIRNRTAALKNWAIVVAAALIVLSPAAIRNLLVGGELVLTTSSAGMNFYIGNNPESTGLYWEAPFLSSVEPGFENLEYQIEASRRSGKQMTTREAGGYWMRQSFDWILHEPGAWLKLLTKKAFYFFSRAEFANNVSIYIGKELSGLLRWNPVGFWLLAPLGLAGLLLALKRLGWRRTQVGWWWLAAYFIGCVGFFVSSEYRYPIILALAAGAGFLITGLAAALRARSFEGALRLLALALLFMPLVNLRTNFVVRGENARMDWFNLGNVRLKMGDYTAAIASFERSLSVDPYFEEAIHSLADAYYRIGKIDKVVELGKRVGLQEPEDMLKIVRADALREAFALIGEGRYGEAMTEFNYAGWDSSKAVAETTRSSRLNNARLAYEAGRQDETLNYFRLIWADDDSVDPAVAYNIGLLHFQANRMDSAEFYARAGLAADSLNLPAVQLLARVLQRTDRGEEAHRLMSRVSPEAAEHPRLLEEVRARMDSLEAAGEWEAALTAYRPYGILGYEMEAADKLRVGRLQLEVGNTELSLRLLLEAEAAGIGGEALMLAKGRALTALKRYDEAAAALEEAARLNPHGVEIRIALARLRLKTGNADAALNDLNAVNHLNIVHRKTLEEYQALMDSVKARL